MNFDRGWPRPFFKILGMLRVNYRLLNENTLKILFSILNWCCCKKSKCVQPGKYLHVVLDMALYSWAPIRRGRGQ
jgi:hypothetical protein